MKKFAKILMGSTLSTRLLIFLLILSLTAVSLPQPARAATCAKAYTVKSGDTLSKIAFDYGVTVEAIAAENNLKSPYLIVIGQALCLPSSSSSGTSTSTSSSTTGTSTSTQKNQITVVDISKRIFLELSNFPKKTVYYVKVNDGGRRNYVWYRLGTVQTNISGAAQVSFKMPDKMRDKSTVAVCLKNAITDAVYCTRSYRTAK